MSRTTKRALCLAGGTLLVCFVGLLCFATLIFRATPSLPANADAVVVLTGGELRLRQGLNLFAAGAGRRLLISGVNRATTRDDLRRLSGVQPILFECCVDVGYSALDTSGNARETRSWLATWGFRKLIVVTSNYHMPRALLELGRELPGVDLVPHPVTSKHYEWDEAWKHPSAIKRIAVEYAKMYPALVRWALARLVGPRDEAPLFPPSQREVLSRPRQLSGL